ncbi:DUF2891 domain-containing protein [Granulicella arctica]|uniref:DUF2891 domain-containing protein n=1 Tax=Granulicella arctica TaxID=940613 RepID=UPI0021E09D86|nr:DUF2891 domain-containing protein [Granulicella arctica]
MRRASRYLGAIVVSVALASASLHSGAQEHDRTRIEAYLKTLPPVIQPAFTVEQASTLAAWPLPCMDHPQPSPEGGLYLWQYDAKPRLEENYDKTHAFYSCYDWHSAVNSSWTIVALLKDFPELPLAKLLHEKITDHLGEQNITGEVAFFKDAKGFEKPYGYAWLLKLYAEIKTWNDPAAAKLMANLQPLVDLFSGKLVEFFDHLPYASRTGVHPNTALSMTLVLDYTSVVADPKLQDAVLRNATRLFAKDERCPTWFEPGGTELLSPCLAEAQLMSHTMDRAAYAQWLSRFLSVVYSADFQPLIKPVEISALQSPEELAGKSHLIGLAFHRAFAMTSIADALPQNDPRAEVFRALSAREAASGFSVLTDAGYMGSHWLGTYAVLYLRASRHDPPHQPAVAAP